MIKKILFLFLLSLQCFSQNTFTVYFDTNSFKLNEVEQEKLHQFLKIDTRRVVKVVGFCDYRLSNAYNHDLSVNRAKYIRDYLELNSDNKNIKIEAKGENFKKNTDFALNRKVEIIFEEISLAEQISKLKKGDKLILKNLNFFNNTDNILPESKVVMDELLHILKSVPKLKIDIQGHICCQTSEGADETEDIANVRALAVYSFLVFAGIDEKRLSYQSFKSSKPIYPIPEKNEEQRTANRRVEIMILEN